MLRRRYRCEKLWQRRSFRRPEKHVQHHAGSPVEDEPNQVLPGGSHGKFLGFVITSKGIHLDPEKVHAIQEMQPLRNLKELRGLQRRLAYMEIYIESFSALPILHQTNKEGSVIHLGQCLPKAFEEIKKCLTHTRSGSSSIRKIFPVICASYGSFLRSLTSSK